MGVKKREERKEIESIFGRSRVPKLVFIQNRTLLDICKWWPRRHTRSSVQVTVATQHGGSSSHAKKHERKDNAGLHI